MIRGSLWRCRMSFVCMSRMGEFDSASPFLFLLAMGCSCFCGYPFYRMVANNRPQGHRLEAYELPHWKSCRGSEPRICRAIHHNVSEIQTSESNSRAELSHLMTPACLPNTRREALGMERLSCVVDVNAHERCLCPLEVSSNTHAHIKLFRSSLMLLLSL